MREVLRKLLSDRPRAVAAATGAAVLLAGTVWFFTASSERGRTAQLSADAWYYHAWLPTLAHDHDVDFTDQYRVFGNFYCFPDAAPGRPGNPFGVGPAIFELPLFAVGGAIAELAGSDVNGFSQPEVEASLYASLLASLAALLFAWRLIRRRLDAPWTAIAAPLLVLCGGPVIYYAVRQPGYAHPFATLFAAWLIDAWDASFAGAPRSRRTWAVLGGLFGLAVLARPQLALWGFLLAVAGVDDLVRGRRGAGVRGLLAAARTAAPGWGLAIAAMLVALLPQLVVWKALYGHLWLVPQGDGFMRWDDPAWSETLFSSRNGLFAWAPLYALGGLGLLVAVARLPRLAGCLVAGVALQAVANGAAWDWWAGGSFGGRRFDSCYLAFGFGLAALALLPRLVAPARLRAGALRAVAAGWTGLVLALGLALAVGNLLLAAHTAAHSARIDGGQSPAVVLRKSLPGPLGPITARTSALATWPARAWFGWRHDVDRGSYDYAVGYHFLEERYPGLNCRGKPSRQRLTLSGYPRRLFGLARGRGGAMMLTGGAARVLLGFNRYGPVSFHLGGLQPPPGAERAEVVLRLDGDEIGRGWIDPAHREVDGTARELARGVNTLTIEAPPGTQVEWLELSGPATALGDRTH